MKGIFLTIAIVIIVNIILYSVFAFATWEFNPKYWDAFLRGIFAIFSLFISLFCGVGTYYETR
jgi:hypothetical protein